MQKTSFLVSINRPLLTFYSKSDQMNKDYTGYTAEKLLNDDFFVQSEQHPTLVTIAFWESQIEKDPLLKKEINVARLFIHKFKQGVQFPPLLPTDVFNLWQKIQSRNRIKYYRRYWIVSISAIAASICIFFFIPFTKDKDNINYQHIISSLPQTENNKNIQLIFSQKEKMSISEDDSQIDYNEKGEIHVNSTKVNIPSEKKEKVELNKLIVPAGKRSSLTLVDGTKIWVNSNTTIIYPSSFSKNKREIYINGEAYLEVAHNFQKPFYVKTEQIDVKVLGTSFNICAYQEDQNQQVVLVNGKVEVNTIDKKKEMLTPGKLFEYDKQNGEASVTTVNTNNFTSWKNGYYQFSNQPLSILFKRLSRYYGQPIVWDKKVGALICSGKLDLTENLEDVLNGLKEASPIKIEYDHSLITIKYEPLN